MARLRWLGVVGLTLASMAASRWLSGVVAVTQDGRKRGRLARSPLGMTWLGWRDVLARTWSETMEDRLLSLSAGVAFFLLLAFAPGLSVLVSVYGLFADPRLVGDHLTPLLGVLPQEGVLLVEDQLKRLASRPADTLSLNLILSLAVAGWSANAGIKGLFDALNVINDEQERRSFLYFNAISLVTTFSAVALMLVVMFGVALLPRLIEMLPYHSAFAWALSLLRFPLLIAIAAGAFALLYWVGPSRRAARLSWLWPGAILAAAVWVAASSAFAWYASTLGNYTATYGSLAAIVIFMTWLWLSASIILVGAELNAELEHQTAMDTTVGPPKPLGLRGAVMADNIGPAVTDK